MTIPVEAPATALGPSVALVPARRGEGDLHRRIKLEASRFLFERGFRALATEVEVKCSGIVDVAGVAKHASRTTLKFWVGKEAPRAGMDGLTILVEVKASRADFLTDRREWTPKDTTRDGTPRPPEKVAEIRDDYLFAGFGREWGAGKYQRASGAHEAHLLYLAAPYRMVKPHEVPKGWGLLEMKLDGTMVRVHDIPPTRIMSHAETSDWNSALRTMTSKANG